MRNNVSEDIQITYLRFLGKKNILKFISKYMHNIHFQSLTGEVFNSTV